MTLKRKPPALCSGCPLYGYGTGYVQDKFVEGAQATICLSTPSHDEAKRGAAGYGSGWLKVVDSYLPLLGQTEDDVNVTHAVRCMKMRKKRDGSLSVVPFADDKRDDGLLFRAALHCAKHDQPEKEGQVVIAMGPAAFAKYSAVHEEVEGHSSWRGHLLP